MKRNWHWNSSETPEQMQAMLEVYETVIPGKSAIYCSGPITSGRLAINWFQNHPSATLDVDALPDELRKEFFKTIVVENTKKLNLLASSVRAKTAGCVIDPSAVREGSWNQTQWRHFWCKVISRFAKEVILTEDWQFSKGSCSECLFALKAGIPVKFYDGSNIGVKRAVHEIGSAIQEMQSRGFKTDFFEDILSDFHADSA